jgi:hypothetical protein
MRKRRLTEYWTRTTTLKKTTKTKKMIWSLKSLLAAQDTDVVDIVRKRNLRMNLTSCAITKPRRRSALITSASAKTNCSKFRRKRTRRSERRLTNDASAKKKDSRKLRKTRRRRLMLERKLRGPKKSA